VIQKVCYISLILTLLGCRSNNNVSPTSQKALFNEYAKGFEIFYTDSCTLLRVYNPWQGAKNVDYNYFFVDSTKHFYVKPNDNTEVFKTPIKRLVCLSTTHIAYIDELKETSTIIGVSGISFVNSSSLISRIKNGEVKDVGYDQNLNYELIVSLRPDAVLCYGVGAESVGYLLKLKELGIKLIFIGEYLEDNPLGKAEWIKAFGAILNLKNRADSSFKSIMIEYKNAAKLVQSVKTKPKVFLNLPYKDSWYFPGGSNYFIKMVEDAGGEYLFKSLEGSKSYTINFEKAVETGMNADVWLNPGAAYNIADIKQSDERLLSLLPVKNGRVYNNNLRSTSTGGNDFWESGVVYPNLVLKDLIYILHPDLLPNHKFYYYRKIE